MSTVKNLNIRPKARNLKMRLVAVGLGTLLIVGSIAIPFAVRAHVNNVDAERTEIVTTFYGHDSKEKTILDYIKVSENLHDLDLEKYSFSDDLLQKYGITNELKSSNEINSLITEFKSSNKNINSKDLDERSKSIEVVLDLQNQEKLVNNYIYDTGYFVANNNIRRATKEYAAETFGINSDGISFKYHSDSSGDESYSITNNLSKYEKEKYNFNSFFQSSQEQVIKKGILSMINTDTSYDKNPNDNDKYNKERNDNIKRALYDSAMLCLENNETNLYNESLANKLK